ncbi:hypothetical protein MD484_g4254, partial [Candolleomyces efflorescens]
MAVIADNVGSLGYAPDFATGALQRWFSSLHVVDIHVYEVSFKFGGVVYPYEVTSSESDPVLPSTNGDLASRPTNGDIHKNTRTGTSWIYVTALNRWTKADTRVGAKGVPVQRFPLDVVGGSRRLADCEWVLRNRWYDTPDLTRAAQLSDGEASTSRIRAGPVERPASSVDLGVGSRQAEAAGTGATESPSPRPNKWLQDLLELWRSGPASRVLSQGPRGVAILETLIAFDKPIPRLVDETDASKCCILIGKADRRGRPLSTKLALVDLLEARQVGFSDSTTNLEESNASLADFWATQLAILEGKSIDRGSRLLVVFDVPATEAGLLACKLSPTPYNAGQGTIVSPLANSWTHAGAITHPHMDGFACAVWTAHWKGVKLWGMWPPTVKNLRLMEHSLTSNPHIDVTIELLTQLEGMELMLLTEDDHFEFAFCLLPNTIHFCLSFTECCHVGMPIRDVRFMDTVEVVIDWAGDFIQNRLGVADGVGEDERGRVIDDYRNDIEYWESISSHQLGRPVRRRLSTLLANARGTLEAV